MKKLLVFILTYLLVVHLYAQNNVGIGGSNPDPSAILDLLTTNKGLGMPNLTTTQRNQISNPKIGLTIYNITDSCLQTYNGTTWSCNAITIVNTINNPPQGNCHYCLRVDTVFLTAHQINFLGDTPVNIIPDPGTGKYIALESVAVRLYPGSTAFSCSGEIKFFFDFMGWSNFDRSIQGSFMNGTISNVTVAQKMQPDYLNGMENQGFWMRADYNPFPQTGNGVAKVIVAYFVIDI